MSSSRHTSMASSRVCCTRGSPSANDGRLRRGGIGEVAREHGLARTVEPGDVDQLAAELSALVLGDRAAALREELETRQGRGGGTLRRAAVARQTIALYEDPLGRGADRDRRLILWLSAARSFTHIGYPITLWLLDYRPGRPRREVRGPSSARFRRQSIPTPRRRFCPSVSLIIAAYNEETVIEAKVKNALELEYPREPFRSSSPRTAHRIAP